MAEPEELVPGQTYSNFDIERLMGFPEGFMESMEDNDAGIAWVENGEWTHGGLDE